MGSVEEHSGGNAMSIASSGYHLRDLWRSPRGTVLRIEALALVAISLSFFLALFGSCRRWSNGWIVQKGFMAAQVLSLSLGTYSIGLMQSSPVKSEMYPIWAVSLLTLFGCIDPVTTNIHHDYKGPLSKLIFQLFLYVGYVMLIGVSTTSSDIGKLAIGVLSIITFIKGFHRSLAFILPGLIQTEMDQWIGAAEPAALAAGDGERLGVHLEMYLSSSMEGLSDPTTMADIQKLSLPKDTPANGIMIKDVCLSYSFSHLLRRHFLGLESPSDVVPMEEKLMAFERLVQDNSTKIDYMQALKVVEVELAFLFEAFFTSSEFLYFYQAKTGSFWALASFIGICFVGVVAAIIPGEMASHHNIINSAAAATGGAGASTSVVVNIVGTTVADLIITLVILVSLALLQLLQLIRCWTSNWARVGIACEYAIKAKKQMSQDEGEMSQDEGEMSQDEGDGPIDDPQRRHSSNTRSSRINQIISRWVMGMRLFLVARVNWFDNYLWQARLGQDSLVALLHRRRAQDCRESVLKMAFSCCIFRDDPDPQPVLNIYLRWLHRVGLVYVFEVVATLLLSDTSNPGGAVKLHDDVKASTAEFLGTIKSRRIGVEWSALFVENGLQDWLEYLPYTNISFPARWRLRTWKRESEAYAFAQRVMIWHIATWYCEEADKAAGGEDSSSCSNREKNRRVAMDLSKYCVYLLVSAPELLRGPAKDTKEAWEDALSSTQYVDHEEGITLEAMQRVSADDGSFAIPSFEFLSGVYLGKRLRNDAMTTPLTVTRHEGPWGRIVEDEEQSTRRPCSTDHWELLARLWVQTLLYAAPYGDVQAHLQRLAQGGEFITHLWALLFHLGIDKWEVAGIEELKAAAAGTEETTEVQEVAAQEDAESCCSSSSGIDELKQQRRRRKYRQRSNLIVKHLHRRCRATKKELPERRQGKEAGGAVGELPREAGAAQVARKTAQEPREDEIEEVPN